MRPSRRAVPALLAVLAIAGASACNNNDNINNGVTGPAGERVYVQVERLGNPLVSEVFFPKRDHGLHNNKTPADDPKPMEQGGTDVPGHIKAFTDAFNRGAKIPATLAAVLSPDMLLVFPNRAGNTAGWLSWALANGYGGRKLTDDVVDAGLTAVFGNLLDPNAPVLAGLTSDNVGPSVRSFSATFPYLESPR